LELRDVIALDRLRAQIAAILVGLVVVRPRRDHAIVVRLRELQLAEEAPHDRPVEEERNGARSELQRPLIRFEGALLLAEEAVERAEGVEARGIVIDCAPRRVGRLESLPGAAKRMQAARLLHERSAVARG